MAPWIDYQLPPELIAQEPLRNRVDARLLVVDRQRDRFDHRYVRDLPELLRQGDRVVLNDTKVILAQLRGERLETGGRWQGLFLNATPNGDWTLVCKTRGTLHAPEPIMLLDRDGRPAEKLWLVERLSEGRWLGRLDKSQDAHAVLERIGRVPLPPYIRGGAMVDDDVERYQTVFARRPGAVAAPTAGLHMTPQLLKAMANKGVDFSALTLHVGMGTFRPLTDDDPARHVMHSEWLEVSAAAASEINESRRQGQRIVAIGTTVVRALETVAREQQQRDGEASLIDAWSGETSLFVRPGHEFLAVDAMLTNFHFPRTTLLLLVQALGGTDLIGRAYQAAIEEEYRFYSYGDAMLIV